MKVYCFSEKEIRSAFLRTDIEKMDFPGGASGKDLPASAGDIRDLGSIPGLGSSPGGRNGNPLQYSCLKDPMGREAWWAAVHGFQRAGHN